MRPASYHLPRSDGHAPSSGIPPRRNPGDPCSSAASAGGRKSSGLRPARPAGPYRNFNDLTKDAVVQDRVLRQLPEGRQALSRHPQRPAGEGLPDGDEDRPGHRHQAASSAERCSASSRQCRRHRAARRAALSGPEAPPLHRHEQRAAAKAVDLTFGASVLEVAKIESFREDSAVVIDAANWFVSDLSGIGQAVRFAVSTVPGRPGAANLRPDRQLPRVRQGLPPERQRSSQAHLPAPGAGRLRVGAGRPLSPDRDPLYAGRAPRRADDATVRR